MSDGPSTKASWIVGRKVYRLLSGGDSIRKCPQLELGFCTISPGSAEFRVYRYGRVKLTFGFLPHSQGVVELSSTKMGHRIGWIKLQGQPVSVKSLLFSIKRH